MDWFLSPSFRSFPLAPSWGALGSIPHRLFHSYLKSSSERGPECLVWNNIQLQVAALAGLNILLLLLSGKSDDEESLCKSAHGAEKEPLRTARTISAPASQNHLDNPTEESIQGLVKNLNATGRNAEEGRGWRPSHSVSFGLSGESRQAPGETDQE